MSRVMGIAEARKAFSQVVTQASQGGERIIIEKRGKPLVAIISFEDYHRLEAVEREACMAILERARAVREMIRAEREGEPLPDSTEEVRSMRQERSHELAGVC